MRFEEPPTTGEMAFSIGYLNPMFDVFRMMGYVAGTMWHHGMRTDTEELRAFVAEAIREYMRHRDYRAWVECLACGAECMPVPPGHFGPGFRRYVDFYFDECGGGLNPHPFYRCGACDGQLPLTTEAPR